MMTSNTHPAREPASPYLRAWPLWVASVLVPLLFLAVVAYRCWQLERDEVYSGVARTAETLSAYTLRTFEAQDSLLAAVDSFTAGMRWDKIASSSQLTAFM